MIREYGPEHTVLSSDLGQQGRSHPAAGLERVANAQLETGVREADLERMLKQDPATLLGLS